MRTTIATFGVEGEINFGSPCCIYKYQLSEKTSSPTSCSIPAYTAIPVPAERQHSHVTQRNAAVTQYKQIQERVRCHGKHVNSSTTSVSYGFPCQQRGHAMEGFT